MSKGKKFYHVKHLSVWSDDASCNCDTTVHICFWAMGTECFGDRWYMNSGGGYSNLNRMSAFAPIMCGAVLAAFLCAVHLVVMDSG